MAAEGNAMFLQLALRFSLCTAAWTAAIRTLISIFIAKRHLNYTRTDMLVTHRLS